MKKFTRRFLAALFACVLMTSVFMSYDMSIVYADTSGSCGDHATWKYDVTTKTLTISGTGATTDFRDSDVGGDTSPWIDYKATMLNLVVNDGIEEIGDYAFFNCTALKNVSLPETLTKLGGASILTKTYGCFRQCTALENITLPDSLTEIEEYVFEDCTSLKKIIIPNNVTKIGKRAFTGCTALERVTFGTNVETIGEYCFYGTGVKRVNWNDKITAIPTGAFNSSACVEVYLPETIASVGLYAYANCSFLRNIYVYNSNTTFRLDFCNGSHQAITIYGHSGSTAEAFVTKYAGSTYNRNYTFVSIDGCNHENTHTEVTQEPTCTETGTELTICDDCGRTVREETLAATGHEWGEPINTLDYTEENGHVYNSYVCSVCDEVKTEVVHQYAREIDPDSIDASAININSLAQIYQLISGFDWSQLGEESVYKWVDGYYDVNTLREADCTSYGGELYTCTVDGCSKRELRPIAPSHNVTRWIENKQPTCTEDGSRQGTCTECGETVTETLKATGHTYDPENPTDVYDSEADGHTHKVYHCSKCNEDFEEYVHNEWVDGCYTATSTSYDNCELPGIELDTCDICGEYRTVTIPARGEHDYYDVSYDPPTCNTGGIHHMACHNCSYTRTKEDDDKLGHDYQPAESTNNKDATCTTNGSQFYKCSRCSSSKTETIPALGHEPVEGTWVVDTEPKCEETGTGHGTCSRCGEEYTGSIPALGHDYQQTENDLASENKPGHVQIVNKCSRCTSRYEEVEHREWIDSYYTVRYSTEPSCIAGATEFRICDVCKKTELVQTTDPLGHLWRYTGTLTSDMISTGSITLPEGISSGGLSGNEAIQSVLSRLPVTAEVTDAGVVYKGNVTADGVVFLCPHCMSTTTKHIAEVKALWTSDLINTEPCRTTIVIHNKGEANEEVEEIDQNAYLDLNGDGIINGRDWGYIKTLTALEAEAVAAAAEEQTEE